MISLLVLCGQNNFYSTNTKVKLWAGDVTGLDTSLTALTEVRQNFSFIFFLSLPYLKPPHVWPGHRSISRLGSYLSGVLAPHLRPKWWTRAKTWTSFFFFFFFTCAWLRPPRAINVCFCETETAGQCETRILKKEEEEEGGKKKIQMFFLVDLWRLPQETRGSVGSRTGRTGVSHGYTWLPVCIYT